jgi:hypothetical protein
MKGIARKTRDLAVLYLKWAWPLVLVDAALVTWAGPPASLWRTLINDAAFAWVLCAPVAPLSLLLSRPRRERAMARLCGLRDGDERERVITGEAARATLLLALSLETLLLVLTLVSVRVVWDPTATKPGKHGLVEVGLSFSSSRHLDPFGAATAVFKPAAPKEAVEAGGYLLSPAAFPPLALLILIQLAAFRGFALRRYEGEDA